MKYNPEIHHRQSIRLKGYDYSQNGAYFVTICTQNREHFFGEIIDGKMELNGAGEMIITEWNELQKRFHNIQLDEYIVMPNHFHGIVCIGNDENVGVPLVGTLMNDDINIRAGTNINNIRAGTRPAPTDGTPNNNNMNDDNVRVLLVGTLGDIIGAFKSITTFEYIDGVKNNNWQPFGGKLWQRNYYEHIIRDEVSLDKIRAYIIDNPHSWETDDMNVL